jgi:hypothetical protein
MKYKVIKTFTFIQNDTIIIINEKSIIDNNLVDTKNGTFKIEQSVIDNNTEYFQEVDWKIDLLQYLKANKIAQPAILSKKLIPFIDNLLKNNDK